VGVVTRPVRLAQQAERAAEPVELMGQPLLARLPAAEKVGRRQRVARLELAQVAHLQQQMALLALNIREAMAAAMPAAAVAVVIMAEGAAREMTMALPAAVVAQVSEIP
jgi:hypothetical protein